MQASNAPVHQRQEQRKRDQKREEKVVVIEIESDDDDVGIDGISPLRKRIEEKTARRCAEKHQWITVANSFTYTGEKRELFQSRTATRVSVTDFVKSCWRLDHTMRRAQRTRGVNRIRLLQRVKALNIKLYTSYLACGYSQFELLYSSMSSITVRARDELNGGRTAEIRLPPNYFESGMILKEFTDRQSKEDGRESAVNYIHARNDQSVGFSVFTVQA